MNRTFLIIFLLASIHPSTQCMEKSKDHTAALLNAVTKGSKTEVTQILDKNPRLINQKGKGGRTPLFQATIMGNVEVAQLLLNYKAYPHIDDGYGKFPLNTAAQNGDDKMVKLLLENKADPNQESYQESTPLHKALPHKCHSDKHYRTVEILLEHKADPNKGKRRNDPIFCEGMVSSFLLIQGGIGI